jgi:hypothetical protein
MEERVINYEGMKIGLFVSGVRTGVATYGGKLNELPDRFLSPDKALNKTEREVYKFIRQRGDKNNGDTRTPQKAIAEHVGITERHAYRILNKLYRLKFCSVDSVRIKTKTGKTKTTRIIRDLLMYVQRGCRPLIGVLRQGGRNLKRFLKPFNWKQLMNHEHPKHDLAVANLDPHHDTFDYESSMMVDLMNNGDTEAQKILGKPRILKLRDLSEHYTTLLYDRWDILEMKGIATEVNMQKILDETVDDYYEAVDEFNKDRFSNRSED